MGLVATPLDSNSYSITGSENLSYFPPAITRVLSAEELENLLGLYQGSGGQLSGLSNTVLSGATIFLEVVPQEKTNKLESILTDISETFKLTKDQQVAIYRIQSRKTVYNWIDKTSVPHQTTMRRIYALFSITEAWQQAGFQITKEELLYPILNDLSVFNLLSQDVLNKEQILFAGSRLNLEREISTPFNDPFV